MYFFSRYKEALLDFRTDDAKAFLDELIRAQGVDYALENLVTASLKEIGEDWAKGDLALSQVYMAARNTETICQELLEENQEDDSDSEVAITALGDFHVLGKKIMLTVLRSSRIKVQDLGGGRSVGEIADMIIEKGIKVLLVSTLMYPSALLVKDLRTLLRTKNYDLKILVGGAPFNFDHELYKQVEADAMGTGPADAISFIKQFAPAALQSKREQP